MTNALGRPGPGTSVALAFVRAGHTGVSLFFILSGFLLSLPFLAEAGGGKRVDRRRYYGRRALRILPLYYTVVVVTTVLSSVASVDLLRGLPYLCFLNSLPGWSTPILGSVVWWSLATEVQFYLVLPVLAVVARGRWLVIGILAVYAVAYGAFALDVRLRTLRGSWRLGLSLFGRGPLFAFGILAAWIYLRHGAALRTRWARVPWLAAGGADAVLLAVLISLGYLLRWVARVGVNGAEIGYFAWHLAEGALWCAAVLLVLLAPLRARRLICNPVLGSLGLLSYSVYLLHTPFVLTTLVEVRRRMAPLPLVGWSPQMAMTAGVMTIALLGLSIVTYRLIERPFLVRKARLAL